MSAPPRAHPGLSALSLDELLDALGGPGVPGSGSAAAATVASAAALVSMCARVSRGRWPEAGGVAAQAELLRARAGTLVDADATAYREARAALRAVRDGGATPADLKFLLDRAAEMPARIAAVAADVAVLAGLAAGEADDDVRPDAVAAAQLAAGAARAAAHLVDVNLATDQEHAFVASAAGSADAAAVAAARALERAEH